MIAIILALGGAIDCDAAARRSAVDYRQCLSAADKQADAEMVRQWRITLAALRTEDAINRRNKANKPDLASGLLASQRAWLRYRAAECDMVSDQAAGGTGYGQLGVECSIALTRQRTQILKSRTAGFVHYSR